MLGFKALGHAQRFLSAYGPITQHFRPRHHRLPAPEYRPRDGPTIPDLAGDYRYTDGRVRAGQDAVFPLLRLVRASAPIR